MVCWKGKGEMKKTMTIETAKDVYHVLKPLLGKKWEELSPMEKKLFSHPKVTKALSILYSKRCFFCRTRFKKPLYDHGFNGEFLFHVHTTHGYPPPLLGTMIKETIEGARK